MRLRQGLWVLSISLVVSSRYCVRYCIIDNSVVESKFPSDSAQDEYKADNLMSNDCYMLQGVVSAS